MNTFTTRALSVCTGLLLGLSVSTSAWSAKTLEQVMKDREVAPRNGEQVAHSRPLATWEAEISL